MKHPFRAKTLCTLLIKATNGVLMSLRGSPYGAEYGEPLSSLRPCWATFLNCLQGISIGPVTMRTDPLERRSRVCQHTLSLTLATVLLVVSCCPTLAHADSLAIIANKNNPNSSLSTNAVASIYRGETLHWPGGDRIKLVNREISAEERKLFYLRVLNAKPDQVFYRQGTPIPVQSVIERSGEAVVRFVGTIEGAIGYVSLSRLKEMNVGEVKVILIIENP